MALVTVQRSPSVASSPQGSISDGEAEEDDSEKCDKSSSECFFAGKGASLVVSLGDIPQNVTERRRSTDSIKSTNSIVSNCSDIQQHLQSMFYLLRHEETLKMAVKLESQRSGRTRYLAIVSRTVNANSNHKKKKRPISAFSISAGKITEKTEKQQPQKCSCNSDENKTLNIDGSDQCSENCNCRTNNENNNSSDDLLLNKTNTKSNTICDKTMDKNFCPDDDDKDSFETEESCLLGIDCNEKTTIGLVLRVLADTTIRLDGDGGFSICVYGRTHIFKPVSVQAMWSALQTLHKVSSKARENNYYPGGPSHEWVSYYEERIASERSCLNEWNAMDSIESRRPPSPDAIRNKPTKREETESIIRMKLKEVMMSVDLDEVTSKYIRSRLEKDLNMDLGEYKSFIDEEMLVILGQMDAPTEIFDHVFLGSEWNASNLEELQRNGVRHILNVTREIDNFFPGMFDYLNVRVYDDEKTNLLKHWDNTFKYIHRAKAEGSKVLVHCKMGVSRSASVVIAYAMKAYDWDFDHALQHVKTKRSCVKPNKNFLAQLETYCGMLDAMKNREKLQRSKSETNLKSVKDATLLPGSKPTPLIQALNYSKKLEKAFTTAKYTKKMRRSSSTSPKSLHSNSVIVAKQQSQSMENIVLECRITDEQKNVRYPGQNGQNYSVTPNQVRHIQQNVPAPSVKTIISELELNEQRARKDRNILNLRLSDEGEANEQIEDLDKNQCIDEAGGDNISNNNDGNNDKPVWTASAQIIHQSTNIKFNEDETNIDVKNQNQEKKDNDVFSSHLDHVFDNEETRQNRNITSCLSSSTCNTNTTADSVVSRQSSCSSVDSAVILGYPGERRELPSRHSSWGSGDVRIAPSRNSSWGSYDINRQSFSNNFNNAAIFEGQIQDFQSDKNNSNVMTQDKEDMSWHRGTVKRTKQKLEENTAPKKKLDTLNKDICTNEQISHRAGIDTGLRKNRSNSEEIIISINIGNNSNNNNNTQPYNTLSASAPEAFTMPKLTEGVTLNHRFSCTYENTSQAQQQAKIAGNVQTLKKNFEAKANTDNSSKKGRSLPSSPVATHDDSRRKQAEKNMESKDFSVKGLVSKYQSSESRHNSPNNYKTRPKSFYESRTFRQHGIDAAKAANARSSMIISNQNEVHNSSKTNEFSRPPVPPIIKNTIGNTTITLRDGIMSTNGSYRTRHQHGKTHPLAKLTKQQRFNTAAYNTM